MTDEEILALPVNPLNAVRKPMVRVTANDYAYNGWLVAVFRKKRGFAIRAAVEDENGRLFFHNPGRISFRVDAQEFYYVHTCIPPPGVVA